MTYLKTGDFVIEHTKLKWNKPLTWLSAAVRFFTHFDYNHGGIITIEKGHIYVIHASTKVKKDKWLDFADPKKKKIQVWRNEAITKPEEYVIEKANSLVGGKYDYASLLFFQLVRALFKVWIGKKGEDAAERLYCSELYAYVHSDLFPNWYELDVSDIIETGKLDIIYDSENGGSKETA